MIRIIPITLVMLLWAFCSWAQTILVPFGANWKYLDNGTNQGAAWRESSFADASWPSGAGKFGYGISDAKTVLSYGTNAKKKYITTYFRTSVLVTDATGYASFSGKIKRDDGVVLYVNGQEVYRNNMPTGAVTYTTLASEALDNGSVSQSFTLDPSAFINGTNVIAVEIHQQRANTPDMAFDLELSGVTAPLDVIAPTVSSINRQIPTAESTTLSTVTFRAIFSEAVTQVDAADFDLATTGTVSGRIESLTPVNAYTYDVSVNSLSGEGTLRLDLKGTNTGIQDLKNYQIQGGFTSGQTYSISPPVVDSTPPTVVSITRQNPAIETTSAATLTFRVTFSEGCTGIDASDFSIAATVTGTLNGLTASSNAIYDVVVANVSGEGTLRLDLNGGATGIQDLAGNALTSGFNSGQTYTHIMVQTTDTDLFGFNSAWRYLDNGTNQGTGWRSLGFEDSGWSTGNGKFGYGIPDASTVVGYGPSATNKFITTYFRKTVTLSTPAAYGNLTINIKMDDGAVVYVNGTEVYRYNMPKGTISGTTLASVSSSGDGSKIQTFTLPYTYFQAGANVIGVEIHQQKASSSDLAFDMEFTSSLKEPTIMYHENFETGTGFAGLHMQSSTTYGFKVVRDTTYSGSWAGRWELRAGDPPAADGTRTEVLFSENFAQEETWHSFAGYFPSANYLLDSDDEAFNQWHQGGEFGSPMITLRTQDGRFEVRRRTADGQSIIFHVLGPIIYDKWLEVVIHIKQHRTDGFMQVWIDGELKLDIKGVPTMYDGPYGKWKMGIYKSDWNNGGVTQSQKRVWFVDEVKIGNAACSIAFMKPTTDHLSNPTASENNLLIHGSALTKTAANTLEVYPSPAKRGTTLTLKSNQPGPMTIRLVDNQGRVRQTTTFTGTTTLQTNPLDSGLYLIQTPGNQKSKGHKFLITD
ncbi:heparin lyase I family protein [Rufibacter soli]